jgi:hypothetical protein
MPTRWIPFCGCVLAIHPRELFLDPVVIMTTPCAQHAHYAAGERVDLATYRRTQDG